MKWKFVKLLTIVAQTKSRETEAYPIYGNLEKNVDSRKEGTYIIYELDPW